MADYVFGANILENLTTGMYKNSQVIFREYIQNACDAIDKATSLSLLSDGEGRIDIWIDAGKRQISIEDNGTGISEQEFEKTLKSIAQSNKQIDIAKGFRGIGRLCGLAYCRELIFSSKAKGENVISVMKVNAQKLRSHFYGKVKYTAQEVLDDVVTIEKIFDDDILDQHWFRVEMIDINSENEILLDVTTIKNYLSFVAPVEYRNYFSFYSKIYKHAADLNFKIDEYQIKINGEQLVKNYKTTFKTSQGEDEIFDLSFRDFYDDNGVLVAWSWIGLSKFKGIIKETTDNPNNQMRSIRLRKGNIQIGDADALQDLFREDRGNHYFIGEIFVVDKDLIPNSQRDYFVENFALKKFEDIVRNYFKELYNVYHSASTVHSAIKAVKSREVAEEKFKNQVFVSKNHEFQEEEKLATIKEKAEISSSKLEQKHSEALANPENILSQVTRRIIEKSKEIQKSSQTKSESSSPVTTKVSNSSNFFPNLNRKERKLVFKILDVIRENVDSKVFEELQSKIVKAINE